MTTHYECHCILCGEDFELLSNEEWECPNCGATDYDIEIVDTVNDNDL